MKMTFGEALNIWSRVVSGDDTLTTDEVKTAAQWFYDFISKLSDKASQSEIALENAVQSQASVETKEKLKKAAESDKRQLDDFIRKYDDLKNWLNQ